MLCKKCRRAFRVDLERAEEADNYCPHCDNCYVSGQAESERAREEEREGVRGRGKSRASEC
jgi:hypothetical protein